MFKIERMAKFAEAMKEQSDVFQEMDANWVQAVYLIWVLVDSFNWPLVYISETRSLAR